MSNEHLVAILKRIFIFPRAGKKQNKLLCRGHLRTGKKIEVNFQPGLQTESFDTHLDLSGFGSFAGKLPRSHYRLRNAIHDSSNQSHMKEELSKNFPGIDHF